MRGKRADNEAVSDVSEDERAAARGGDGVPRRRRRRPEARTSRRVRGRRPPVVPWRMIGFLLGLGILAGFAAVNIEHRSDVSFGFFVFSDVPVFLSILVAFIAGALFVLPLALRRGRRMRDAQLANTATEGQVRAAVAAGAKRRRLLGDGAAGDTVAGDTVVDDTTEDEAGVEEEPLGLAAPGRGSSSRKRGGGTEKPSRRDSSKRSTPRRRGAGGGK